MGDARLGECLIDYFQARLTAMTTARLRIGIGELDARAMIFLADNPGIRPTALREHLGVTSAAVTILIDRLAARGALRRDPDPADRRASRLSTTVDLDAPPWDGLRSFDRQIAAAAARLPDDESRSALDAVDAVLAATRADQP